MKLLEKFIYQNELEEDKYKLFREIIETESFYLATDTYRAAMIFKTEDQTINHTLGNPTDMILSVCKRTIDNNREHITINRKELLNSIKDKVKEIKQKAKEDGITLTDSKIYINLTISQKLEFNLTAKAYLKDSQEISFGTDNSSFSIMNFLNQDVSISFNLKYFMEGIQLVTGKEITLYINSDSKRVDIQPVYMKNEDRFYLLLPVRN